jgi:hypothetical protein
MIELKKCNLIRIIRMNIDPEKEDDFYRWYTSEHEHLLLKVPGVIWTYKGTSLGNKEQKYFFLYVHENMATQQIDQYKTASQTAWAKEIRPFLKDFEAVNYQVIVPGFVPTRFEKGSIIRTVQMSVSPDYEEDLNEWYDTRHIPLLKKVPGVTTIWRGLNLGEKGQKYATVYFHESITVQQREDYKNAYDTLWIKSLFPHLKDLAEFDFEVRF